MEAPSNTPPAQGPSHPPSVSGITQIRSRVTVVCAECKRLKLKCDRRTPCSSCIKRDTISRCTYSAAAAEKIDVQSLHNRVLVLEAQLSQLTSGRMRLPSDLDRALLAVGASGSSVLISLDDAAGLWLEHLDLSRDNSVDLCPAALNNFEPDSCPPDPFPSHNKIIHPLNYIPQLLSNAVTPELLALLPSTSQRPALLDVLTSICRMHPSLNFPHFRARINLMFVDNSGPEEIGIGPPRTSFLEKPSLSFFAAAAAGFALALQCAPNLTIPMSPRTTSSSGSPSPPTSQPTASSLLSLSGQVLQSIEDLNEPFDLDFLHALILRCLCMLHDGHPRVNQAVFAAVGKMVNIARVMGLSKDPDEFARKYSLWEAEMRRRMWWDVFYYDVFVSDCMGFPPMISDDQHTTRIPADVDEDAFVPKSVSLPPPSDYLYSSNFSYFLLKCKLAQLVKNMKKRVNLNSDQSASNPSGSNGVNGGAAAQDPCLETANQAETEVKQFLNDLPQAYQLDLEADPFDPTYSSSGSSPPTSNVPPAYLIVQRCELAIIAHQLILKLFLPFLRRPGIKSSDNSMIAPINSAHSIIKAASIVRGVWQKQAIGGSDTPGMGASTIPSSHGVFYPFSRQVFDAAVVAAHIVIRCPQSIVSSVAMDDLRLAIGVLQDPTLTTGRGRSLQRGGVEGAPSEAVTVVQMLLRKVEMARRNYTPVSAGTKRKHDEVEPNFSKGFWLPYVGSGVATDLKKASSVVVNGHNQSSPTNRSIDKVEICLPGSVVRSTSERDQLKYPPSLRSKTSSSSLNKMKPASGALHHRRDSSHSSNLSVVPPPSMPVLPPDPDTFVRPNTASGLPSSVGAESASRPTASYSHGATYTIEESRNIDLSVSSTARFSSQTPSATDTHGYAQSFPPRSSTSTQPAAYDSTAYNPEHDRSPAATSYYVFPQPPVSSAFPTMNDHSQPQPHSRGHTHDTPQPPQHMMMDMIPGGPHVIDTNDTSRAVKQDDHQLQRRNSLSTTEASSFSAEGWTSNPAISRFSHSPWDNGYTY